MELEDLLIRRYRVEKIKGRMVAYPDEYGNYQACSADDVERALTGGKTLEEPVYVLLSGGSRGPKSRKWHKLAGTIKK